MQSYFYPAGIGENVGALRKDICNYFGYLGVEIDDKANDTFSEEIVISTPASKVKVAVILPMKNLQSAEIQ